MLRASFALKDSRCHRLSIIDFTEDEQLMSVYIYILMVTVTVCVDILGLRKTTDQRYRAHLCEMNIASFSNHASPAGIAYGSSLA